MQLKNQNERKAFVENYKSWGVWFEVPQVEMKYYRYVLPDETQIIVSEHLHRGYDYETKSNKTRPLIKYHLVVPMNIRWPAVSYTGGNEFKHFSPNGNGLTTIMKYLAETRPEVQI